MNKGTLFLALLPLILFWAVEEFFGLKTALVVGCIAAILEIAYEKIRYKKVTFVTWISNMLVLGLGAVSYVFDSGIAFKLQPAIMEVGMGAMMLFTSIRGEPFLIKMMKEFKGVDVEKRDALMQVPWFVERLKSANTRLIVFFFLHAIALTWAAIWGSSRIWILLKGVLFYVLLVVVMAPMYIRPKQN